MDQASPEGGVLPSTGAPVTQPPPAQDIAAKPSETTAESPPAKVDEQQERKGVGKRIDELTRLRRDAERERDHWRELAMRQQPQPQQSQPSEEKEKTLEDFKFDTNAYMRYASERIRASADKEARAAAERYRAEQDAITRRARFDERLSAFGKSAEGFDDVIEWMESKSAPVSEGMADYLLDSEEAGPVLQYLHENPDEATRIYRMSPAKAGRELTKLEDQIVTERKKAAEKPVTKAPPPAPTIEASTPSTAVKSTDAEAEKLSGDEWRKLREKELAARRKRG